MNDTIKLLEYNKGFINKIKSDPDGVFRYRCNHRLISGKTINGILHFVKGLCKQYQKTKILVEFDFGNVEFADKLTYIIFECICYTLIKDYQYSVRVILYPMNNIYADNVESSPLRILSEFGKENGQNFLKCFDFYLYQNHFRKVISRNKLANTNYLGSLLGELSSFFKFFNVKNECIEPIILMVTELAGNAHEHADSDCLIDIDVSQEYYKEHKSVRQEGTYYGINIVILNFSDVLLSSDMQKLLSTSSLNQLEPETNLVRYFKLKQALDYHRNYFNEKYTYEDFCSLAILQDQISGRPFSSVTPNAIAGGTGLTSLIKSVQDQCENNDCYVLSGAKSVYFNRDCLNYDKDKWLGFNLKSDFFNAIPDNNVITECFIYFPGTAYNLNFILRSEDDKK